MQTATECNRETVIHIDCSACGYKGLVEDRGHVVYCPNCPGGAKVERAVKREQI